RTDRGRAGKFKTAFSLLRSSPARSESERASPLRYLCPVGSRDREPYSVRPSNRESDYGAATARKGIRGSFGARFTRSLVRSLRNERQTKRRFFIGQLQRSALHPD